MHIREATPADIPQITRIYNHYVSATIISFETGPVTETELTARMHRVQQAYPYLAAEEDGKILGYAYLSVYRARAAYRHLAESSVYVQHDLRGRGTGSKLYAALIEAGRDYGYREIIGVVALPNPASVRLHQKFGFREIGTIERAGYKFGKFVDTSYWQLNLAA